LDETELEKCDIVNRIEHFIEEFKSQYNNDSDFKSGGDYETHCCLLLEKSGWETKMTPPTGDHGVDILAKKEGKTLAIQCKYYSTPVGNSAVSEVVAGKNFYYANEAAVVSNASYTLKARELAKANNVYLLHHSDLERFSW
jgi:HJR/Mrr/RecB family endonuclease